MKALQFICPLYKVFIFVVIHVFAILFFRKKMKKRNVKNPTNFISTLCKIELSGSVTTLTSLLLSSWTQGGRIESPVSLCLCLWVTLSSENKDRNNVLLLKFIPGLYLSLC